MACTEPIVLILKQEYKVRLSAVEGSQSINRICYITLTCILSSDKQNAVSLHKNQYACLQKLTKAHYYSKTKLMVKITWNAYTCI